MFRNCDTRSIQSQSPPTPLLHALRCCTVPEQHEWAELAGTSRNYLYQLATCERRAGLRTALRIVESSKQMHIATTGRVPKISLNDLLT